MTSLTLWWDLCRVRGSAVGTAVLSGYYPQASRFLPVASPQLCGPWVQPCGQTCKPVQRRFTGLLLTCAVLGSGFSAAVALVFSTPYGISAPLCRIAPGAFYSTSREEQSGSVLCEVYGSIEGMGSWTGRGDPPSCAIAFAHIFDPEMHVCIMSV